MLKKQKAKTVAFSAVLLTLNIQSGWVKDSVGPWTALCRGTDDVLLKPAPLMIAVFFLQECTEVLRSEARDSKEDRQCRESEGEKNREREREQKSNIRKKMWEIWKATSGTSQYVDRQLSAVEKAADKVFITQKMVRIFWVLGREAVEVFVCTV